MDNAFSERNLDAAGGVAGAERVGAAEIRVIKAMDASRPVRFPVLWLDAGSTAQATRLLSWPVGRKLSR